MTGQRSADFVPVPERIATFDNDGTLWFEHPMYAQLAFALDRLEALAPQHPEWTEQATLQGRSGAGHEDPCGSGRERPGRIDHGDPRRHDRPSEFETIVTDWLATARHPRFDRPYTEFVYQPMLELLAFLRANGF